MTALMKSFCVSSHSSCCVAAKVLRWKKWRKKKSGSSFFYKFSIQLHFQIKREVFIKENPSDAWATFFIISVWFLFLHDSSDAKVSECMATSEFHSLTGKICTCVRVGVCVCACVTFFCCPFSTCASTSSLQHPHRPADRLTKSTFFYFFYFSHRTQFQLELGLQIYLRDIAVAQIEAG